MQPRLRIITGLTQLAMFHYGLLVTLSLQLQSLQGIYGK
jgi:hypothetical protein